MKKYQRLLINFLSLCADKNTLEHRELAREIVRPYLFELNKLGCDEQLITLGLAKKHPRQTLYKGVNY